MASSTAVSVALPDAGALEYLVAENADLRQKLEAPVEQRVASEVVAGEVNPFLRAVLSEFLSRDAAVWGDDPSQEPSEEHTDAPVGSASPGPARTAGRAYWALSQALRNACQEKGALECQMRELLENTVAPLNQQVESLEAEKRTLQARVGELEALVQDRSPPVFVTELEQLRKAEEVLLEQLRESQVRDEAAVENVRGALRDGVAMAHTLPDYAQVIEELKGALCSSRASRTFLTLELEEQQTRFSVLRQLEETAFADERAAVLERMELLTRQLEDARHREEAVLTEKSKTEERLQATLSELEFVKTQQQDTEKSHGAKRKRAEEATEHSCPSSLRQQLIQFWYDGKDTISDLERQVAELKKSVAENRIAHGRMAQVERVRANTTTHLASLTAEVAKVREDNQKHRASIVGLEVERDQLLHIVAKGLEGHMSHEELETCCREIRASATDRAAASAAVMTDPETVQQAIRKAQELKNEVASLQKQRDRLGHLVAAQEARVAALMEHEAVQRYGARGGTSSITGSHTSTPSLAPPFVAGLVNSPNTSWISSGKGSSSGSQRDSERPTGSGGHGGRADAAASAAMALPQFLERVYHNALDIFRTNERSAVGILDEGTNDPIARAALDRHKESFVAVHTRLIESQERLLSSQRKLQEALDSCTALASEVDRIKGESAAAVEAKEAVVRATESTNVALLSRTTSLTAEKTSLQQQLASVTAFAEQMLQCLDGVFALFRKETRFVAKLRQLIVQERKEMVELVRRESAPWVSGGGDNGDGSTDSAASAVRSVSDAIDRLSRYIQECVEAQHVHSETERTEFLAKLVDAVQEQESRIAELQKSFAETSCAQAAALAERVASAQRAWECEWKKKYEALAQEHAQQSVVENSQRALQTALECAATSLPSAPQNSDAEPSAELADDVDLASSQAAQQATIEAIDRYIQSAMARMSATAAPHVEPTLTATSSEQGIAAPLPRDGDAAATEVATGEASEEAQVPSPELAAEHAEALTREEEGEREEEEKEV